jgi:hypothetical protein
MTHTPVAALLLPARPASAVMPAAENRDAPSLLRACACRLAGGSVIVTLTAVADACMNVLLF